MATKLFVNLTVKDLKASIKFFEQLGYSFNPQFTDENAACMIIGEDNYAMLVSEPFFQQFTPKKIADAKTTTECLIALSHDSRESVNELVQKAVAAGGRIYAEAKDYGFMYQHGFEDLDGHIWEHFWMNADYVQK